MSVGRSSSFEGAAAPPRPLFLIVLAALAVPFSLASPDFSASYQNPSSPFPQPRVAPHPPAYTIRREGVDPYTGNEDKTIHGYLYYYSPQPYPVEKSDGYQHSVGLFVTMFLVPLLALVGISYAVPSSGVQLVLRRSMAEGDPSIIGDMNDIQERLQQIYLAATGSEVCLRKLVCDLGASNKNLDDHHKNLLVRLFDLWTPKIYRSFATDYVDGLMLNNTCSRFKCKDSPPPPKGINEI